MSEVTAENELEMIELSTEQAKEKIALAEALERLQKNRDYKKIFTNKFFNTHATRLVKLKADMRMQDEPNQKYINSQIDAIGQLNQFMLFVKQEGVIAEQTIASNEEARESIHSEGA